MQAKSRTAGILLQGAKKDARNADLFFENAWTPFKYDNLQQRNLYITEFEVEKVTAYTLAVEVNLLPPFQFWKCPKHYMNPCLPNLVFSKI